MNEPHTLLNVRSWLGLISVFRYSAPEDSVAALLERVPRTAMYMTNPSTATETMTYSAMMAGEVAVVPVDRTEVDDALQKRTNE